MRAGAAIVLAAALLAACAGPKPRVVSAQLRPASGTGGSVVEVVLHNDRGGEGQVEIEVTLRSGDTLTRLHEEVTLHGHERLSVFVPVPGSVDPGAQVEAGVRYPVD